ncbi:Uma2 family endonuclease [Jiella pacifica]|uniref:Uma2 family endonuclease n=1 Tax=Jiella pacifica TaxID=2696469 RepID=A0A6N9T7L9_9HYPH|nr:Uma2 family endonuclease [Jiella pacifica]NDW06215.1 Uma2 family endonuclease [Jiella pacifica]
MSLLETRPWTLDEFFAWQVEQEEQYELVGGFPLLQSRSLMGHNLAVANIIGEIGQRLRGEPCRVFTADIGIETLPGQIRRPDAGIDCGSFDPDGYLAAEPVVVFEVLSPSTRDFDRLRKVDEYKRVSTMRHIVVVEPTRPQVLVWSRGGEEGSDWTPEEILGVDGVIHLDAVSIDLPLAELYDRLTFQP